MPALREVHPHRRAPAVRALAALAIALSLGSCAFAVKHPAVTAGIVAGSIGFVTCFTAVEKPGTCGVVGLGAGFAIGGVTWLATTIFEPNAPPDEEDAENPGGLQRVRGSGPPPGPYLPPEPNPLPATALPDAGVPMAPVDGAAPADASGAESPVAP